MNVGVINSFQVLFVICRTKLNYITSKDSPQTIGWGRTIWHATRKERCSAAFVFFIKFLVRYE
jgi:hypothetical protein